MEETQTQTYKVLFMRKDDFRPARVYQSGEQGEEGTLMTNTQPYLIWSGKKVGKLKVK
jgi:hypothetical protein